MSILKKCKKCGETKPIERFNKNQKTRDRYYGACKDCCLVYHREYIEKNRERILQKREEKRKAVVRKEKKKTVVRKKEKRIVVRAIRKERVFFCARCGVRVVLAEGEGPRKYCGKECRALARPKENYPIPATCKTCGNEIKKQNKKYCSKECASRAQMVEGAIWKDPEKVKIYQREYQRKWYKKNRDKVLEQAKERHRKNPTLRQSHLVRYRATRASLPDDFTHDDWLNCLEYWNHSCAVCGRPQGLFHTLAADHWIPLSSKDCIGTVPHNILPLCHGTDGCNNSKSDSDAAQWLVIKLGEKKAKKKLDQVLVYFSKVKR